jgi:hypothetical protein
MSMALYLRLRSREKMRNYISLLLESEAVNRRLARSFRSEEFDRATRQSIAIVTRDSSRAAQKERPSKMPQKNRHEGTQVSNRRRTVNSDLGSDDTKRDLSVFSFMLALMLAGVVLAAHTEHPVFWLFIGPIPVALLYTARTFLRQRVIRRKGMLLFTKLVRLCQETLLTKNAQPNRCRPASTFLRDRC